MRLQKREIDMNTKMNPGMKALKKEAPEVASKMGYMYGGMTKKKTGYNKGGYVSCGASNPPAQKRSK